MMKRFFVLIPLILVSCSSQEKLHIRTVSVPARIRVDSSDPTTLIRAAPKVGGRVRSWSVPIDSNGTFSMERHTMDTFVTAWDPPTSDHPSARPVEYGSKLLGVTATGKVIKATDRREVQLAFADCQKIGLRHWGSGVEQPVYSTFSIETSVVVSPSEWAILHETPARTNDLDRHYLLVRTP